MFAVEYAVRRRVLPGRQRAGILDGLRAFWRHSVLRAFRGAPLTGPGPMPSAQRFPAGELLPLSDIATRRRSPRGGAASRSRRDACSPTCDAPRRRCPTAATCSTAAPTATVSRWRSWPPSRVARRRSFPPRPRRPWCAPCANSRQTRISSPRTSPWRWTCLAPRSRSARPRNPKSPRRPPSPRRTSPRSSSPPAPPGNPSPMRRPGAASRATSGRRRMRLGITGPGHAILGTVPPQHMYGFESTVLLPLLSGAALSRGAALLPRRHRRRDRAHAARAHARHHALPPAQLAGERRGGADSRPSSAATAPLSEALAREAEARTGARLLEIYGCTETGQLATRTADAVARVARLRRDRPAREGRSRMGERRAHRRSPRPSPT